MTDFDTREQSQYGGQPVECYRFNRGTQIWLLTSADRAIELPAGTFAPEVLTRTSLDFSEEDSGEMLKITVPRTSPILEAFIGEYASTPLGLILYRAHRGDEASYVTAFSGKAIGAEFSSDSEGTITFASLLNLLKRRVPPMAVQTPCNHALFSAECGANPTSSRDSVQVTTVTGATVVSNDFSLRADQWFRGGRLELPGGESRFISDHVGDTVTLLSPLPGLESLDQCWAYWGCDHLEATCRSKFNNVVNHLGWTRIPQKNPTNTRID